MGSEERSIDEPGGAFSNYELRFFKGDDEDASISDLSGDDNTLDADMFDEIFSPPRLVRERSSFATASGGDASASRYRPPRSTWNAHEAQPGSYASGVPSPPRLQRSRTFTARTTSESSGVATAYTRNESSGQSSSSMPPPPSRGPPLGGKGGKGGRGRPVAGRVPPVRAQGPQGPPQAFRWRVGPRRGADVAPSFLPTAADDDAEEFLHPGYSEQHDGSARGSRRWVFTLNNPSEEEWDALLAYCQASTEWADLGKEVAASGTPHIQGTMRFKNVKTFSAVKKIKCFSHCWLNMAHGTEQHCKDYSEKDGDFVEIHPENFSPGQGTRRDIHQNAALVRDEGHRGVRTIVDADPMFIIRYHRGIAALRELVTHPRDLDLPPTSVFIWGESGHGKTVLARKLARIAAQACGDSSFFEAHCGAHPWYPNYLDQKVVLINEFSTTSAKMQPIPMQHWLSMWDQGGCVLEYKNGTFQLQANQFFTTGIRHPRDYFPDTPEMPSYQFLRRITKVIKCVRTGDSPDNYEYTTIDQGNGLVPLVLP